MALMWSARRTEAGALDDSAQKVRRRWKRFYLTVSVRDDGCETAHKNDFIEIVAVI